MKNLIFTFIAVLGLGLVGCQNNNVIDDDSSTKKTELRNNKSSEVIGYLNENNEFTALTSEQVYKFINSMLSEDDKKISDYNIYKDSSEYFLATSTTNSHGNRVSLTLEVKKQDDELSYVFPSTGVSCKCETIDCASNGCDPSIFARRCSCSPCDGDCKKTTEIYSNIAEFIKRL